MLTKAQLRRELRQRRRQLSLAEQQSAATEVAQHLRSLLKPRQKAAVYFANPPELSLEPLIALREELALELFVPWATRDSRQMKLLAVSEDTPRQIFSEQASAPRVPISWAELDLILLPLVAVDGDGYRLGQGGGYYDATLRDFPQVKRCGVGYAWQLLAELPHDSWDLRLDYFVSEQGIHTFSGHPW